MTKKKEDAVIAFKGFDENFRCRGFQYEVGKTYEHYGEVKICASGFHACESPFDVWSYYGPHESRFAKVSAAGEVERHSEDSKIASARITIDAELTLPQFIKSGIDWLLALTKNVKGSSGYSAQIGSSGDSAKIGSSGYSAQIGSSGDSAQIGSSGGYAQIGSSGNYAQIGSSGYYAKIGSSGYSAKIGSSGYSAKIGSSGGYAQIGSSGDSAQIGSSGYSAQIGSSGDSAQIEATGKDSVIACAGSVYKFKLGEDGCIAVRYHDGDRNRFVVGYVGENLKADVWYQITDDGKFGEVE